MTICGMGSLAPRLMAKLIKHTFNTGEIVGALQQLEKIPARAGQLWNGFWIVVLFLGNVGVLSQRYSHAIEYFLT